MAHVGALDNCGKTVRERRALTLLDPANQVLEEVDGYGVIGWQVCSCIHCKEVVHLPLTLVLGSELCCCDRFHGFALIFNTDCNHLLMWSTKHT